MRKRQETRLHVVLVASRGGTGPRQRCGRPGRPAARRGQILHAYHSRQSPYQTTQNETHLSDDEVLQELGKFNDLVARLESVFVKVTPTHELHRDGPQLEGALRARLVQERFAQDLHNQLAPPLQRPHIVRDGIDVEQE